MYYTDTERKKTFLEFGNAFRVKVLNVQIIDSNLLLILLSLHLVISILYLIIDDIVIVRQLVAYTIYLHIPVHV